MSGGFKYNDGYKVRVLVDNETLEQAIEENGVGIQKVEQTYTANGSGENNVITIYLTNGVQSNVQIKNGVNGVNGYPRLPTSRPANSQVGDIWIENI